MATTRFITTLGFLTLTVLIAASVHRAAAATTTTTVEIVNMVTEESSKGCRQEIERQRLSSCREYLRDSSRFVLPENEGRGGGWREEFPRCCEELQQINQQCRCQAVKQVAQEQRQAGGLQGREMREMLRTAQSLPSLCRIPPLYCQNVGGRPMF